MASPFDPTYGVAFITFFLATMQDKWGIKTVVGLSPDTHLVLTDALRIFETMQIVLHLDGLYLNFIDNFGNPSHSTSGCRFDTTFKAQLFFGSNCALVQLGRFSLNAPLKASTIRVSTIQTACTVACDIVITVSLIHTLSQKRGGFDATNSMLTTLIINAVNRGALTALCVVLNMIMFLAKPDTFYFFIGLILSGKLYMNPRLATLNTRQYIRNKGQDSEGVFPLDIVSSEGSESRGPHSNQANTVNSDIIVLKQATTTTQIISDRLTAKRPIWGTIRPP
ncbi:hypothetical protein B0H14DRAFT_3155037 [Mycena olivaceomarginata]|nr:hypothetical protein B0H14DRAFT_3155037 [Mycena olivaceomarginata]